MGRNTTLIFYIVLMVAIIVTMDLLFFRHRFRERLIANIAIVLVFAIFYLIFLRRK
jgi:membrane protein YdbS with pleckstrin-like domain